MRSLTVMAPKVVGATSLAKRGEKLSYLWLTLLPPLRYEVCSDCVCAEDTRGCSVVPVVEGGWWCSWT